MPGWLQRKPNRRRARAKGPDRFRPWLEELEPRTAFAVSSPAALAVPQFTPALITTTPGQEAIVLSPAAGPGVSPAQPGSLTTTPGFNAGAALPALAPPLGVSSGALSPQTPVAQTTFQAPEALSANSTAPLAVLSYADYQLTSGLNPALAAGQLPTLLNTPAVNALFEVGGNATGAPTFTQATAGTGTGAVVPVNAVVPLIITPIDGNLAPADDGPAAEGPMSSLRFRHPARPAAQGADAPTDDYGPAAPEAAVPLTELQAAPAAATSADAEW
jgi:hypothetical protein